MTTTESHSRISSSLPTTPRRLVPRHVNAIHIIDILPLGLDAVAAGAEDAVPQARLLAVVAALAPALAVVEVVVLEHKVAVDHLQEDGRDAGGRGAHADAGVAESFREDEVLVANPPVIKAHGEAHQLEHGVGGQGHEGDLDDLLLCVGVGGHQRVGVLGEVVRAVVLPQAVDLVAGAVVGVEEEVEHDRVEKELGGQPGAEGDRVGALVGEEEGEDRPDSGGEFNGEQNLVDADVGDLVAGMFVAIKETNSEGRMLVCLTSQMDLVVFEFTFVQSVAALAPGGCR